MAFTTTQLTAIEAAIASGELEVRYDGKTVRYRDMDDLLAAHAFVKAKLIAAGLLVDTTARGSSTVAAFSRD